MQLDVFTLQVVFTGNLLAAALALPVLLRCQNSRAVNLAQTSMALHAVGWLCLIASGNWAGTWADRLLSVLAMAGIGLSLWTLDGAVRHWTGTQTVNRPMLGLAVVMPFVYGLIFDQYAWRVGLANGVLALIMAWLCVELLRPRPHNSRRWRYILVIALGLQIVTTVWRGWLGAFHPEVYPYFQAPHPVNVAAAWVNNLSLLLTAAALLSAFREEAERQLRALAISDSLTGLLNRRAWNERAEALLADARRYGHPLIVLMIDLDGFKSINDQHGHAQGDAALRLVAQTLTQQLRSGDLAGRYGGEEFCVLLSHTREAAAITLDQRLRAAMHRNAAERLGFPLAYSAGLAAFGPDDADLEQLLRRADAALYEAKRAGRDQLVLAA